MFHFCQFDTPENPKYRYDICSGMFKHINADFINQTEIIIQNQSGEILIVKNEASTWGFVATEKSQSHSPKQAILQKLNDLGIAISPKTLDHFCYQKTLESLDIENVPENQLTWEMTSCQVMFIAAIDALDKPTSENFKWIKPSEISSYIDQIFGIQKTVELVVNLLENK